MNEVIVVGGGISGLSTAWFLRQRGIATTVLEARDEPGGNIHTIERDGYCVDTGPTSTLFRGGALEELIADLGLESQVVEADRSSKRYIVKNNRLNPLPSGIFSFISTPLFSPFAKMRLLTEPLRGRILAEESIAQFVTRRIGQEFLDWAVDPFISGVYAGDPKKLSARAAIPRLYALEAEHGSIFVGAIARIFRKSSGHKINRSRLISFRKGMDTLPHAIARDLGGAVQLNAPVTNIQHMPNGEWFVRTPSNQYRASYLVLALPAPHAARLLALNAPDLAHDLEAIAYPPVASIALGFARNQIAHPLDGFGALFPRKLQRETLGVIFSSTIFPSRAPGGKVLLTAFIGGAGNPAINDQADSELIGRVLADLRPLLGIRGDPIFNCVTLWPQAIPQYELGHNDRIARIDAATSRFPRLYLRANWRDGVSLADSVSNACELAKRIAHEQETRVGV